VDTCPRRETPLDDPAVKVSRDNRRDGVVAEDLAGTWPCPVTAERAARMNGARAAATRLPPPPLPAGSIAARRRVHPDGRIVLN
jgi:hypothetical protein